MDLPAIAAVIKQTKIGQLLKFLPPTLVDLAKTLHSLLAELAETEKSTVKNTLANILEELLRQNAITTERCMAINKYIL